MLIDNENQNKKVHEWISDYSDNGTLDIVTGYFTVGALAYLSQATNEKMKKYRFILGDIVNTEQLQNHTINLLNENISIEASLKLKAVAKEAVKFLQQSKVEAKTLEPNFCHAKAYIFNTKKDNDKTFLMGSSNLTEAGIGLKRTNNIELNIAETGNNYEFQHILEWFNELWNKPQAHYKKTIVDDNGKEKKVDFKEYLIKEIEQIFIEYTPKEMYYKVLFELFGEELLKEQDDPKFNREIGRLENSVIYNTLYDFQQKGVLSLIKMLEHYDGAILADAVGLGKTWSALAVIKYYQLQGRETILLCPKKLEHNWKQYLKRKNSKFKSDELDYIVRYHTDLYEDRLEKDDIDFSHLQSDKPKLIVIDESHNLRNAKSNRYKFLVEHLLKANQNIKVLLLSATPINNSLNDIKNQFNLIIKDNDHGFLDNLDIKSLTGTFRVAQREFNQWATSENKKISKFIEKLPPEFIRLTDSLTVARTRNMIEGLKFPKKKKPQNIFVTPKDIGDFTTFKDMLDSLPPKLTAYKPAYYIEEDTTDVTHNEKLRDKALVKMIYILLAKRFESSWKSFYDTISRVNDYHQSIYNTAVKYRTNKKDVLLTQDEEIKNSDEMFDELSIGKREIKLSQIDSCGELDNFIDDLNEDLTSMKKLLTNLRHFEDSISIEKELTSKDTKLEKLIEILKDKENAENKKVIIFTAYTDTVNYIYDELEKRGIKKMAVVHGGTKKYEPILQRFAPFTKLYNEKEWNDFDGDSYEEWTKWIEQNNPRTKELLDNQIDILIATDVLSEGQNLQDADMVINYDIHWNPVRIIQRMGRIDRIGSINDSIQGVNFWPSKDVNDYLNLQVRIEERMATMKVVGSEIDTNFTDNLQEMAEDENLEKTQTAKMLEKLNVSWDDIEINDTSLGFNDLSLEQFRQDLLDEMRKKNDFYKNMPKGVFSGFVKDNLSENIELVALLKNRQNKQYELIYIDKNGNSLLQNQKEVLEFLAQNKDNLREVPQTIDSGDIKAIEQLQSMITTWATPIKKVKATKLLEGIMKGSKTSINRLEKNETVDKEFDIENYDLVVWMIVS
jgi:ERCC4-related helicase